MGYLDLSGGCLERANTHLMRRDSKFLRGCPGCTFSILSTRVSHVLCTGACSALGDGLLTDLSTKANRGLLPARPLPSSLITPQPGGLAISPLQHWQGLHSLEVKVQFNFWAHPGVHWAAKDPIMKYCWCIFDSTLSVPGCSMDGVNVFPWGLQACL